MIRTASALALLAACLVALPGTARAQERGQPAVAPLAAGASETPRVDGTPTALSYPRTTLSYLPTGERRAGGRGIESATPGVWIGALVGAVAGGLAASWAYCGIGEGDCGFSFTAAGPGMLIGGILGSSIGGLLDQEPAGPDEYDDAHVEELRAYKAEIAPIDPELRARAGEIIESDTFLGAVGSSSAAGIVVDAALRVVAWNQAAEELWGLPPEVADGTSLEDLPLGVVVEDLQEGVLAVALGESEALTRDVEAVDGDGRAIDVRMRIVPFFHEGLRRGVLVLVET